MTWTESVQPIADLVRQTVVGYEVRGADGGPPALDAPRLARALRSRDALPPDCFLAVDLDAAALLDPDVTAVLREQGDLAGVVVEVSESCATPIVEVRQALDRLRRVGALVALDHVGTAPIGLGRLLDLRPEILKLDRGLVGGVDRDEARRAVVEGLGAMADRIDAWVLAGDVATEGELATLAACGVPLAQGPVVGPAGPPWPGLSPDAARALDAVRALDEALRPLVQRAPTVRLGRTDRAAAFADDGIDVTVVVDAADRPVGVLTPDAALSGDVRPALRVRTDTRPADLARRLSAAALDPTVPVLVTDRSGRYQGVVTLRRLLAHLGDEAEPA